jgi:hypothetical protein
MNKTILLAVFLAVGCAPAARAESRGKDAGAFAWKGDVAAGKTVYLRNLNGSIETVPATGKKLRIRAVTTGGAKVEVVEHDGTLTACGFPDAKAHTCGKNGEYDVSGTTRKQSKVEMIVDVPRGVKVDASSVNGDVRVDRNGAAATLETVNGSIEARATGPVKATTVNGGIDVVVDRLSGTSGVTLETVNGTIRVQLPAGADADVRASVVNGSIDSKLALAGEKRSKRSLRGVLGTGGAPVALETVNGSIELR